MENRQQLDCLYGILGVRPTKAISVALNDNHRRSFQETQLSWSHATREDLSTGVKATRFNDVTADLVRVS